MQHHQQKNRPLFGVSDKLLADLMTTTTGRERARAILSDGTVLTAANRRRIFEALTDAATAAGENP